MTTYVYAHYCPRDGDGEVICPYEGEEVAQRPTVMGSYYLLVPVRCSVTHADLVFVRREG